MHCFTPNINNFLFLSAVLLHSMIVQCVSLSSQQNVYVRPRNCTSESSSSVGSMNESYIEQSVSLETALLNLESNSTLVLLPGVHCIDNLHEVLKDLEYVSIRGESSETVRITCGSTVGLAFLSFYELSIENVTIDGCGNSNLKIRNFFNVLVNEKEIELFYTINMLNRNDIALMVGDCYNLHMSKVIIKNTRGLGLLGVNIIGHSELIELVLSHNTPFESSFSVGHVFTQERVGGGALFLYQDYDYNKIIRTNNTLLVRDSNFLYNSYSGSEIAYIAYNRIFSDRRENYYFLGAAGGLSIIMTQYYYRINVIVHNCLFQNNTAKYGSGMFVGKFAGVLDSHVVVTDSVLQQNGISGDLVGDPDYRCEGVGMSLLLDMSRPRLEYFQPSSFVASSTIHISRTLFKQNRASSAGALLIVSLYYPIAGSSGRDIVTVDDCMFVDNSAVRHSAIQALELKASFIQPGVHLILHDIKIINNSLILLNPDATKEQVSDTIQLVSINVTMCGQTNISNNDGSGMSLTGSGVLAFEGDILFSNNVASYGGGLRSESGWIIVITNNTSIRFSNNSASVYGGGIYANSLPGSCLLYWGRVSLYCFGEISLSCSDVLGSLNVSLSFDGNRSPLGSMIYGSSFENCPWAEHLRQTYALNSTNDTLVNILHQGNAFMFFDSSPNSAREVSTPTTTVSIEDKETSVLDIMPGHVFHLAVETLDEFDRFVPTVLSATSGTTEISRNHEGGVTAKIGNSDYYFLGEDPATHDIPLQVFGNPPQTSINISLVSVGSFAQSQFVVNLINCTDGYNYSGESCVCDTRIEASQLNCTDEGNFLVPTGVWIGRGPDDSLLVASCNFDYCLQGERTVSPTNFTTQCNAGYHRQGISCGECQTNYSLSFGSNRCQLCKNTELYLIFVIAVMGILVIAIICFLEITVSDGYLNGALFFSNVVSVYIPIFINGTVVNGTDIMGLFFLSSWLNLGLGFVSCFFDGMNALQRSTLNFIFPLYLYTLMAVIILFASKSRRFAAALSRRSFSPMKLFATLLVMTYGSLLQNCIEILGFNVVSTFNSNILYLWRSDSNQEMFRQFHIPLGIVAIILLIFFIIPAPLILICPVLQVKALKKYVPLYDAFWAPFKPKYRFWVGLRLLLRVFPLLFAYFFIFPFN